MSTELTEKELNKIIKEISIEEGVPEYFIRCEIQKELDRIAWNQRMPDNPTPPFLKAMSYLIRETKKRLL